MRKYLPALALIVFVSCGQSDKKGETRTNEVVTASQTTTVEHVNTEQLKALIKEKDDLQIVDVRTLDEVANGYIDNAMVGMDYLSGEFENKIHILDKEKPIVVYCAKGGRSSKSADILISNGFKEVYNYEDGYSGWSN